MQLLFIWEKNGTDRRQEFFVYQCQARFHSVITNNLSIQGSQQDTTTAGIWQVKRSVVIHDDITLESDSRFSLHDFHIFVHSGSHDSFNGINILSTAINCNSVFLNLDETLDNQLLQELWIVLSLGNNSSLGASFAKKGIQKFVTDLHLLDTAFSNFRRTGNAFLNFLVLFLLGKFVLDIQFGFVNQSLLFQVEIVFRLRIVIVVVIE
mmetsp:Transcript_10502/g.25365  ORF Transcript_10502/g.25365 Transcript_10502/m.25365 type:complete len:208 (-) Transcript_10502:359-982(-)